MESVDPPVRNRVMVPSMEEICALDDEALFSLRILLVDASEAIQGQMQAALDADDASPEWLARSRGALSHMKRGLATIKAELGRRDAARAKARRKRPEVSPAYDGIDALRDVLAAYVELLDAVRAFIDDDSDEAFDVLRALTS